MGTVEKLLHASQNIWGQYHVHPFVRGIRDGTLEREKFRWYILQDYLYLMEYAKVFAIGISKSHNMAVMQLFCSYIQAITDCEMDVHRGYIGKLEISREELEQTPPALANRSYTAYMIQSAYEGGEAEALTAILSCAYSYEIIARTMVEEAPEGTEHSFYGEWIRNYSGERYHRDNLRLLKMLEELTADFSPREMKRLEEIFVTCSRYELAFWDMAWEMES